MGVPLGGEFDVAVTGPIDSRMVWTGDVNALSNISNKYLGLITYATGDRNLYVYQLGAVQGVGAPVWEKIVTTNVDTPPVLTENFTFSAAYNGQILYVSGSNPITGTLPTVGPTLNNMGSGYNVSVVQLGDGNVVFRGTPNTFIRNRLNLSTTAGKYAVASILRLNTSEFLLYGDLV